MTLAASELFFAMHNVVTKMLVCKIKKECLENEYIGGFAYG